MKNQSQSLAYCFAETSVKPEDITCVHAALRSVDPETLLCVLLETRLSWKMDPRLLTGAAKRHLLKKVTSMLSLMYDIEPVPLSAPDQIIIPVQAFEYPGFGIAFTRRISAAILDLTSCASEDARTLDYASCIAQCVPGEGEVPWASGVSSVDGLIGSAWGDVLGCPLWLPSSLTEYERIACVAHLFWVMAFSGFAEAVYEMKTVNVRRHGKASDGDSRVALCFDEYRQKMQAVAALMDANSMVDVRHAAYALKQSLVA